ncbi:class I SAM-dependent methyltransferase [Anabaena cylindrica FACHB-243]|uniref:Methyltransferase type 11 n=1 Tax=Anabaena cylindrica (strain ATCC 27899 / PCC 7122) TaxID=272123 RepID=K9ZJV6_ANACC|nr:MULTISPECIES: class I SAM-dependent methyltransferase [Anabaena]AFZ59054.1 Methyltransferase type 11 [Anabaena cylindrica PCC 7122]MBD2420607.1 class I SAM-dependent methyltransferase [Anabaena cylindrica FACHB-243]MBY5282358.1 class I SAM-dependent methyltransferase [Anabaena sp. CCAP 1446/1C]MBY5309231.1 class I SAM-dependent methyltransferase [Anabaena sp. CCAP 1446/1C]MCM2408565.1 class I SAM-dependent methyltransferase [Anabaena sp. CCAP 1446/1C]
MKIEQVLETYDEVYAEAYNEAFLTDIHSQTKTKHELKILTQLLSEKGTEARWLDVACGTGYYLSCFPEVKKAGLDISPAMLNISRRKNPDIPLIQGNFRDKSLFKKGEWDVISSMWWAYSFAESISEIETLIENICHWLTDDGFCFMPICNPSKNLYSGQTNVPYVATEDAPAYGGKILVTGVIWSWIEASGKRHDNMLVPQMEYMVELFKKYFQSVEIVEYANGYYWGILAAKKERLFDTICSQFTTESLHVTTEKNETLVDNLPLAPARPANFLKRFVHKFLNLNS